MRTEHFTRLCKADRYCIFPTFPYSFPSPVLSLPSFIPSTSLFSFSMPSFHFCPLNFRINVLSKYDLCSSVGSALFETNESCIWDDSMLPISILWKWSVSGDRECGEGELRKKGGLLKVYSSQSILQKLFFSLTYMYI